MDELFPRKKGASGVGPAASSPELLELAGALPPHLRLGTSSWSFPGWTGLVWDGEYSETKLARSGLSAYAQHPLLRTVSLDRSFYKPQSVAQFIELAAQVGDGFRFVVKAPNVITDALIRNDEGQGMKLNPNFLDATQVGRLLVEPALAGLGRKLGPLVFQISPLPNLYLSQIPAMIQRLHTLLKAIPGLRDAAPDGLVAIEVRDCQWLTPQFVEALRDAGATYCLGLHGKMPPVSEQLWILRALWPGPFVCRWNMNLLHGAYGFEEAGRQYEPFDKMVDPDPETRAALVRVIKGTASAGHNVFVTVNNNAEGCAPLSIIELARAISASGA